LKIGNQKRGEKEKRKGTKKKKRGKDREGGEKKKEEPSRTEGKRKGECRGVREVGESFFFEKKKRGIKETGKVHVWEEGGEDLFAGNRINIVKRSRGKRLKLKTRKKFCIKKRREKTRTLY